MDGGEATEELASDTRRELSRAPRFPVEQVPQDRQGDAKQKTRGRARGDEEYRADAYRRGGSACFRDDAGSNTDRMQAITDPCARSLPTGLGGKVEPVEVCLRQRGNDTGRLLRIGRGEADLDDRAQAEICNVQPFQELGQGRALATLWIGVARRARQGLNAGELRIGDEVELLQHFARQSFRLEEPDLALG